MRRASIALTTLLLAASMAACGGGRTATRQSAAATTGTTARPSKAPAQTSTLPRGDEPVRLDPARFTAQIDNPYWPMAPGSRWVYRETDADGNDQRVEVTVTSETRKILGIDARVVHDVATSNGQVQEDTYDWYAQDDQGNVWYMLSLIHI